MTSSLSAGSKLGRCEIRSKLGEGGMGEVYRARDPHIERDVAIKILPEDISSNESRLQRFEQEARAAGKLNHPNILAIHDVDLHNGKPYVVYELLEGETLRDRISKGQLGTRKTIDYALQVAHGLAAAHDKGIIHRDLKPDNIFITRDEAGSPPVRQPSLVRSRHDRPKSGATLAHLLGKPTLRHSRRQKRTSFLLPTTKEHRWFRRRGMTPRLDYRLMENGWRMFQTSPGVTKFMFKASQIRVNDRRFRTTAEEVHVGVLTGVSCFIYRRIRN